MKKKELIEAIKTIITGLSVYGPRFFKVERDAIYMRYGKNDLHQFLADLQKRLEFAERATKLGANIVTRADLRGKPLKMDGELRTY